jgi:tetratricopeptide (TPR) repeat protein
MVALEADRNNPVPLYLSGWALAKSGDTSIGSQRMARAHLIPLSDQGARFDLYEALLERKLTAEATRERDVILRTAESRSWRWSEALRRAGDEAHAAGDAARAADLWERAFLDNNSEETKFVEPWANVSMPALVRRTRAVGLIHAGDVAAGVREAEASLAMSPGDADCLIDVVSALDAAGHKDDADALYESGVARYRQLCEAYPKSGPLHNLYAWAAAKCRRELDAALAHAKRAVELQPTNTASLDTLAEAHFQRAEVADAISVMRRCVELEPDDARHKEQLQRFRSALAGAATRPLAR